MTELLIKSRKYVRKSVTEIYNKKDQFSSYSDIERSTLKLRLEEHFTKLSDLDSKIQNSKFSTECDEAALLVELDACEQYKTKIQESISTLQNLPQVRHLPIDIQSHQSLLKSPHAPLPTFNSTEGEDLGKFFVEFEQTLSKFKFPEYDKLLLLKQQVKGRALTLINILDVQSQSYADAKALLEKALGSREVQIFNTIKQISSIKLSDDDDPFEYIGKVSNLVASVKTLNIDVDMFLQFFFWNGLNEKFKCHMTAITNKIRPSLAEIRDNFFDASERYLQGKKCKKVEKQKSDTTSFAAKVSFDSKVGKCSICSKLGKDPSHFLSKCPNFVSSKDKREKLEELGACSKCGYPSHILSECRFRFNSKCKSCKGWHMSFLCPDEKGATSIKENPNSEKKKVKASNSTDRVKNSESDNGDVVGSSSSSVAAITEVLNCEVEGYTILPTFNISIKGTNLRVLKDTGCQANYIEENLAQDLNLKVVKNGVSLTINGINSSKSYKTKKVEIELPIGSNSYIVYAFCLPSIDVSLQLPGLNEVVSGFVSKGYKLADQGLLNSTDRIDNIKFILGSESLHCIPEKDIVFGKSNDSIYSDTCLGILLKGDINKLKSNLRFLKPCSSMKSNVQHMLKAVNVLPTGTKENVSVESSSLNDLETSNTYELFDDDGQIIESELNRATNECLELSCKYYVGEDGGQYHEDNVELNDRLIEYALEETDRTADGRLCMPLIWNPKVSHLLGRNYNLAKSVLKTLTSKLEKLPDKLALVNETFKTRETLGIIKENMTKAIDYPIGIVKELTKNIYDEVTGAKLMLGKSRRFVKCHVTSLIPLMSSDH
ncbi:uncharacterized protein [Palaemon carinicauda]|uniref:uncharacterized protein n=1 Tax=Palaemon carinicauda TaxID=392227 RepID=UPI0035B59782